MTGTSLQWVLCTTSVTVRPKAVFASFLERSFGRAGNGAIGRAPPRKPIPTVRARLDAVPDTRFHVQLPSTRQTGECERSPVRVDEATVEPRELAYAVPR